MSEIRCIFCGKTENEFDKDNSWSIEHIIPLSLGNTRLITKNVCKDCNNKLGQNVDDYFVNQMLTLMKRKEMGLKGESGKVPNPFRNGIDQFGQKVRIDDALNVTIVPNLTTEETDDEIRIKGHFNSKSEAKETIEKKMKRKGYSIAEIEKVKQKIDQINTSIYQPTVSFSFSIELNRISLFFLKIAYEYSCLRLGERYFNDDIAVEIRGMLYSAICGKMKEKCPTNRFVVNTPSEISDIFSIKEVSHLNIHMLYLHPDKSGKLICEVFLFLEKVTSFSVIVSEKASMYEPLPQNMDIVEIHTSNTQSF